MHLSTLSPTAQLSLIPSTLHIALATAHPHDPSPSLRARGSSGLSICLHHGHEHACPADNSANCTEIWYDSQRVVREPFGSFHFEGRALNASDRRRRPVPQLHGRDVGEQRGRDVPGADERAGDAEDSETGRASSCGSGMKGGKGLEQHEV